MHRLFIGRHGHTDAQRQLDERGTQDALHMAARLQELGFTGGIILASPTPRTSRTAAIIGEALGISAIMEDSLLRTAGEQPGSLKSLHALVAKILAAHNPAGHAEADIMVVTHKPLVSAVAGRDVSYGEVFLVPEGWINPYYHYPASGV